MTLKEIQNYNFPILIGDIGGTNARFCVLENASDALGEIAVVKTESYETIDDAIQSAVLNKGSNKPRTVILALAGPIDGDEVDLTNCHWIVRPKTLINTLGFEDVILINDFEAQALATASANDSDLEKIGGGVKENFSSKLVLGPGTGLGTGGLISSPSGWIPLPGEGGHIDLGPRTQRDYEIFPHLETIDERISAEQILCGRGLVNLYQAICKADGSPNLLTQPFEITREALDAEGSKEAVETLSLFATYLGRVAGDLSLVFMARGGVYLAGGISQKILPVLRAPEFRAAFEDKAPHNDLVKQIPTFVMTHEQAALVGLADYAQNTQNFALSTKGRYWSKN